MLRSPLRIVVCVAALAVIVASEGCGSSPARQLRTPTPDAVATSKLAYLTVESPTGGLSGVVSHLYIATPGQTPTKVRDYPGQQYYEMLASPDGSKIAVTNGAAIIILDDRGDQVMQLDAPALSWSGAGPFAGWSPDSAQFAYTRADPSSGRIGWIETVDVAKRAITTPSQLKAVALSMPSYSPDGKRFVAIHTNYSEASALAVVDAGSGDHRTLKGQPATTLGTPLWSPDGRWIAYWLPNGWDAPDGRILEGESVYITTPDGSAPRQLAAAGFLSPQAWSPDGKQLALACGESSSQSSTTAGLNGGSSSTSTVAGTLNVCIVDPAGGAPTLLTDDGGSFGAAFAPDGTHIAYLSDRDKTTGTYTLKVVNPDTREITTIATSVIIGGFTWLPGDSSATR